jgi:hypothetical protein
MPRASTVFPPQPPSLRGRAHELRTLATAVRAAHPTKIALVGAGGSGKSTLACALGYRVARRFPGGLHWFRVGAWDARTLAQMLAIRLGIPHARPALLRDVARHLAARGDALVVLDNHEDDRAVASLLDALRDAPVTWIVTARRCLLGGVSIFPVVAPLVTAGESAFPRVASLTRLLRWNPLALDLADALVSAGEIDEASLRAHLEARGVGRVRVVDHEDDVPEVAALVGWSFARLSPASRRALAVLAHTAGDHVDRASLLALARAGDDALAALQRLRLVQEPIAGRLALHATVRYAIERRTSFDPRRLFEHYVALLEREPERLDLEQTHLFAAMDHANASGDLDASLRVHRLVTRLEEAGATAARPG